MPYPSLPRTGWRIEDNVVLSTLNSAQPGIRLEYTRGVEIRRNVVPFVQVSGLTHTVVPSVRTPGTLVVTFSWPAVTGVEKYMVWDETQRILADSPATSYTETAVRVGRSLTICVSAQYPYNVAQPSTAPCLVITT